MGEAVCGQGRGPWCGKRRDKPSPFSLTPSRALSLSLSSSSSAPLYSPPSLPLPPLFLCLSLLPSPPLLPSPRLSAAVLQLQSGPRRLRLRRLPRTLPSRAGGMRPLSLARPIRTESAAIKSQGGMRPSPAWDRDTLRDGEGGGAQSGQSRPAPLLRVAAREPAAAPLAAAARYMRACRGGQGRRRRRARS